MQLSHEDQLAVFLPVITTKVVLFTSFFLAGKCSAFKTSFFFPQVEVYAEADFCRGETRVHITHTHTHSLTDANANTSLDALRINWPKDKFTPGIRNLR